MSIPIVSGNMAEPTPNVDNYMIGKGVLLIAPFSDSLVDADFIDVGNCPRFEFELSEQSIPHVSSRNRVSEEDAEFVIRTGYSVNFTLDEFSINNMKMFLRGNLYGVNHIHAGQDLTGRFALRFISNNSAGPDIRYDFHKCKLSPNGALSLITEDYGAMSFAGKGLADRENNPSSPFFNATFANVSTTTSTTSTTTTTVTVADPADA
jgi:hypothetical protein